MAFVFLGGNVYVLLSILLSIRRLRQSVRGSAFRDSVLERILSSRKSWAMANRFWHLCTGSEFGPGDAFTFPGELAVADEVAKAGSYYKVNPGRTHEHLVPLNPDLALEVWDPTLGEFVPAHVREAQAPGQTGQGATLQLPEGLLDRAQASVDGLVAKAKQALRDELGLGAHN